MDALIIEETPIAGCVVIHTPTRSDARGRFERLYCQDAWDKVRPALRFPQINHSFTTTRGSVRGLHFQSPPHSDAKLIRCIHGRVFDVVVDLRRGSSSFLAWSSFELQADDSRQLFVPEGCAHGFQSLTDDVHMIYMHTRPFMPESEGGIRIDDPRLSIGWPLPVHGLSERDRSHPLLSEGYEGLSL